MIGRIFRAGPRVLADRVGKLPLGRRNDDGIDYRVVDWAMGGLTEQAAREVEFRLHGYLQEAADVGRDLARRQGLFWLAACVPVWIAWIAFLLV